MADNIKIIGNINDVQRVNRLKLEDLKLLQSEVKNQTFGFENDYIEYFIYDAGGNLISSNYNYRNFKLPSDSFLTPGAKLPLIEIDPVNDLQTLGYISGEFKTQYNFQTRKISSPEAELFISQISEDRTEIRINSTIISSSDLLNYGNKLIDELNNSIEQRYFLLNLDSNTQFLIVNVAVDPSDSSILFKLYEPLPQLIQDKTSVWVTEEIIEPYIFTLNLDTSIIPEDALKLKGPNFNIEVDIKHNLGTQYENYSSLVSSLTGSSYQKILNYMNDNSYDLNIDYTLFENFIHFSSAEKRLNVFYDKVKKIENYNNDINIITGSTNVLKNEQTSSIKLKINDITTNFDGFENYLYYESSSYAWPKSGNSKPYSLLSTGSTIVKSWYNLYTGSAENYDEENLDRLYNVIPNYVKNDPDNYQSYYNFVDMIGHYFDNIWIYITSINELYNADNNLEKGVSKDIVYDALTSLGVKLYNSKGDNDFEDYIVGLNSGSTLFTDNFSFTSSYLNNIPKKDLLAETYKRIYHNIPLISKTKGTSAGLKNLITSFGVTSSIISPKEFGGSTKKNEIKGYDNDKITIYNNTITGSVLSSIVSLQQETTASTEFTSTDLHFVDVSFSPQNQLNQRLSASIASTNPTFSLDQYIGDPGLMASSSYSSLIQQNNYFMSASSAISGSAKRLDYKGFFELIKYFDNSLFKMLKDFVPARTNALTGVTIKSPILERNKVPVYQPNVSEQTVHEADYAGPEFTESVDPVYNAIGGNKSIYYTGEFSGSYVDVYDYFENSFPNPYTLPSTSIDLNTFNHTDFNVMLNNVSSSVISISRKKLEPLYTNVNGRIYNVNTGSNINTSSAAYEFTSSIELQDSNLSLQGHKNSRYNGTKLSSITYNTYTSASTTYGGDISYGKTAVIDQHVRKLGLFSQIRTNPFFNLPSRNSTSLTYLVDESGSLTGLNKQNKHWHEVQNTFKAGGNLVVSLFDNQKYSNQKSTDGLKPIFNSGYSYFPMLYASKTDEKLYFNYTGDSLSRLFKINTLGGYVNGNDISLGQSVTYPITSDKVFKLFSGSIDTFDPAYNDGNIYYTNAISQFPTYSIQETGEQKFNALFNVVNGFSNVGLSGSYTFNIKKIGAGASPSTTLASQTLAHTSSAVTTLFNSGYTYTSVTGDTYTLPYDTIVKDVGGTPTGDVIPASTVLYKIIVYSYVSGCNGYGSTQFYVRSSYYSAITATTPYCTGASTIYLLPGSPQLYQLPQTALSQTLNFDVETSYQAFTSGDKIGFEFLVNSVDFNTTNFTSSIVAGGTLYNQLAANQVGNNPYATSSITPFISGSAGNRTIVLKTELSYFENYKFIPSGSTPGNLSTLYSLYGDVDYTFSPKPGDEIIIYYGGSGNFYESNINYTYTSGSQLYLVLNSDLPSNLSIGPYNSNTVDKFLFLTKIEDETNTILTFDRPSGNTSIGFLIPENLHPDVLANLDTITKEVKQKLIDIGFTDGGAF